MHWYSEYWDLPELLDAGGSRLNKLPENLIFKPHPLMWGHVGSGGEGGGGGGGILACSLSPPPLPSPQAFIPTPEIESEHHWKLSKNRYNTRLLHYSSTRVLSLPCPQRSLARSKEKKRNVWSGHPLLTLECKRGEGRKKYWCPKKTGGENWQNLQRSELWISLGKNQQKHPLFPYI